MDLYFERHDGQAVTCDDFRMAMADANGRDLTQFERWYSQAGTPVVQAETRWDEQAQTYTLRLIQSCPPTPGQAEKLPFHIPVAVGLLGQDGRDLPLTVDGKDYGTTAVL
jgi:aminopeptidase N